MKPLALNTVAEYAGGKLVCGSPDRYITGVSMDSRFVKPGNLFVALRGQSQDGHHFLSEAYKAGAIAALVERMPQDFHDKTFGLIVAADSLQALQRLASEYRKELKARVIAVTGSSGKSSTKEMIASVLSQGFPTHKNRESFNNHTGVPLTLLEATAEHQCIVVELGMNHPGELEPLVQIAQPNIGVVTNIGWAHVEAFEDREAIAKEKGVLIRKLPKEGFAVLNADDPYVRAMASTTLARSILAGSAADAAYRYEKLEFRDNTVVFSLHTPQGKADIVLNVPAAHMVKNAVLAAAVGGELGVSLEGIVQGLSAFELPKQRCAILRSQQGWIVDDSYNANPDSMLAALEMLQTLPGSGRCVALLGMMGELGKQSEALHRMIGQAAVEKGIKILFALGKDSRFLIDEAQKAGLSSEACQWFENHSALAQAYQKIAQPQDKILIKGSRSQQMEQVTKQLMQGGGPCSIT